MKPQIKKEILVNYGEITRSITAIKLYKEGFLTNFYYGEEYCSMLIEKRLLYIAAYEKCVFILRGDHDFYHLYFLSAGKDSLRESLAALTSQYSDHTFASDIIGSESVVNDIAAIYAQCGFEGYARLYRMSRTKNLVEPQRLDARVEWATMEDAKRIHALLEKYFDPYCEQLPLAEELRGWIEARRVAVVRERGDAAGFVIFEINGQTSYLRYWFVHPDHREKKIGSALLRRFFHECGASKRQLFWVIESNENAIARYRHYGFDAEPLFDQVMVKKVKGEREMQDV